MKKQLSLFMTFMGALLFSLSYAQENLPSKTEQNTDSIVVGHSGPDKAYFEDQFYLGLSLNFILNRPKGVNQRGFSGGIQLGYIRDIPLNERRNIALGIGLGWAVNTYGSNLLISERVKSEEAIFQVLDDNYNYEANKFNTYLIQVPIRFRWRTSSATSYRFWRIYGGLNLGYIYYFHSKFEQTGNNIAQTQVKELNRFRYEAILIFGYNTINFMISYTLNPFFDGLTLDRQAVDLSALKVGLMFYIL